MVMASMEAMLEAAGDAVMDAGASAMTGLESAGTDVLNFIGMGDSSGAAAAKAATSSDSLMNSLASGNSASDIAADDAGTAALNNSSSFAGLKDWTMKGLNKVMPDIMKSAMAPKPHQYAPLGGSGHGIQTNASSSGQVINELGKAVGGDPLQGLAGFKNLL
ncbi:hypothetical protein [Lelliottia nimipressuralis]|uniref:Uncharacterized protein n=1 Tax=Lelliottia nimipressuralis TaxID=69220 RepID=A0ABD4KGM3_9ENTR|nr:hypothetical protein [Lelliottia nimipressuralis]MBF4180588.1 hypothetical protein [Lelliottia nimipressuralis]